MIRFSLTGFLQLAILLLNIGFDFTGTGVFLVPNSQHYERKTIMGNKNQETVMDTKGIGEAARKMLSMGHMDRFAYMGSLGPNLPAVLAELEVLEQRAREESKKDAILQASTLLKGIRSAESQAEKVCQELVSGIALDSRITESLAKYLEAIEENRAINSPALPARTATPTISHLHKVGKDSKGRDLLVRVEYRYSIGDFPKTGKPKGTKAAGTVSNPMV
jgi:hypothetical protein